MDFHPSHQAAIKLAGTVALPSPFPASGAVSIVVAPEDGEHETYLRIVQAITAKRIITRFVRLADVRAIKAPTTPGSPEGPETWALIGPKQIQRMIADMEKKLRASASKSGASTESEWLPSAIVYVPESAPVLHRNDVGVTAAVSAEEVAFSELHEPIRPCSIHHAAFACPAKSSFCPGR
jgi:hypothetical protein